MARKPNYNFEKRQKEITKKAKQDEKKKRKQDDADAAAADTPESEGQTSEEQTE